MYWFLPKEHIECVDLIGRTSEDAKEHVQSRSRGLHNIAQVYRISTLSCDIISYAVPQTHSA